ncbi:MAG: Glutaconate CoA-transferase subunit B [Chloroflexi bacterium ADurb.Bin180]|nr:MAG: Glutaconate CoA-transferase subunit B [Chloroflexi bacterium ADurb.Bin180]HNR96320.1 CoA-transferase [Anaerolineae bacterium]HNT05726.1 CoA-transferase [Anaerolineae bacterium]
MTTFSLTELMAVTAAHEVLDGEVVFAGTGLPMLGAMLAQRTHAPRCCIIFEAGTVASQLAHLPMSVGDPRAMRGAAMAAGLIEVFTYVLQAGRVDVGFLSGAQIDRFGNINSTSIGVDPTHPQVRFSGSGGACDIACLARRTVIIAVHEKRRFPERIHYVTSPGWLEGGDSRAKAGLVRGGPSVVVTTKGVMRFRPDGHEMYLASYHPGLTPQQVADDTGFPLEVDGAVETPAPSAEELEILRRVVDPERVFLR